MNCHETCNGNEMLGGKLAWGCENSYPRNNLWLGMLVVGKGGLPPLE
jgi:hypothetical protein